ncbi:MAG: hypothetical protein U0984_19620 [Prosthecobacter sp.]|nr:hypothetical protein [Prosthecobacter sp.]
MLSLTMVGGMAVLVGAARGQAEAILKVENFSRDPRWEGRNNRVPSKEAAMVTQDFGYSATKLAGQAEGELGGTVQQAMTPAMYADEIAMKTLDTRLSAAGSFAVTKTSGVAGVFFGYFNGKQAGGSGLPIGSLGLQLDFDEAGGHLSARLVDQSNQTCGKIIGPIKGDGLRYRWTLDYDPGANRGNGRFKVMVKSEGKKRESFEGETFVVDLPAELRKSGAVFDRFGLMNLLKAGGGVTLFFDDLRYDGTSEDFTIDPGWTGLGNRLTSAAEEVARAQDFGYRETNHAGGSVGEVGGSFWRSDKGWSYYADRIATVSMAQRLEAGGKVKLVSAGADADMYLGWFSSADAHADQPPCTGRNFLGVHVGGQAGMGHWLAPLYRTAKGTEGKLDKGPVMRPGKACEWSLVHDPAAHQGEGELRLTLDGETVVLPMKPGQLTEGARFDRFGLFTGQPDGQMVKIYFDDLRYSVGQ